MTLHADADSIRARLLGSLHGKSLEERPESAEWIKEIAAAFRSDLGILAVHGASGLAEHLPGQPQIRIPLCGTDNLVLLLARNAIQTRQNLGLAIPPGTIMTPMLIVCTLLLGDLLDRQAWPGPSHRLPGIRDHGGILLVSPDAEMRARYFSMRVGRESVVTSYPACRMRPDGSVVDVSTDVPPRNRFSVCFFLAHHKQLPDRRHMAFKPAVVILDLTHDHWIDRMPDLVEWCLRLRNSRGAQTTLIALLPFGDKLSYEALRSHGVTIFPIDSNEIQTLEEGFIPPPPPKDEITRDAYSAWSFSTYASESPQTRRHAIFPIPDDVSADVLETAGYIYQALHVVNKRQRYHDVQLAAWLVGTLLQLPVPVQWYEQHAYLMGNRQTLKKLISSIGRSAGGSAYFELAPTLQSLRGHLEVLYSKLSTRNPKSEAFLRYYHTSLQPLLMDQKKMALLVRNDVVSRALWPWLLSEGIPADHQRYFQVLAYKQVDGREMFDHVMATGPWPSRYRWQIGGRLGRTVDFLLYRGEDIVLKQQMGLFYSTRSRIQCEKSRFSLLRRFGDIQTIPPSDHLSNEQPVLDLITVTGGGKQEESAPKEMLSPGWGNELGADVLPLLDWDVFEMAPPSTPSSATSIPLTGSPQGAVVSWHDDSFLESGEQAAMHGDGYRDAPSEGSTELCILLKIQMASTSTDAKTIKYLYISNEGETECYLPNQAGGDVTEVSNDAIEPGAILIRTDREDRQTLFEHIVQLAEGQPTMQYLKIWREYWLEAIHSLVQQHASGETKRGAYSLLQQELAKMGVSVTQVTIRGWVRGERIGPGSLASIKAIGALSGHPMLQQYPQQVDMVFKQMRKIHQILGRRISATLQKLGKVARQEKSKASPQSVQRSAQMDPGLSMPIDDLLDMLQFWEVIAVDDGPWPVPPSKVGVIMPNALYGGHVHNE